MWVTDPIRLIPTTLKRSRVVDFATTIAAVETIPPEMAKRNPGLNSEPIRKDPMTIRTITTSNVSHTPNTISVRRDETFANPILRNGKGVGMNDSMTKSAIPTAARSAMVVR
jgi:hypothetical protein